MKIDLNAGENINVYFLTLLNFKYFKNSNFIKQTVKHKPCTHSGSCFITDVLSMILYKYFPIYFPKPPALFGYTIPSFNFNESVAE